MHQLRVVVEAEDYDEALRFYGDALGLAEQESYHGDDDARVTILHAGAATLELSNPSQVRMIDRVETDGDRSDRIRLAFEVDDSPAMTERLADAGATVTATPRETPWRSVNSRLRAPTGLQVTLFQELELQETRIARDGFRAEPEFPHAAEVRGDAGRLDLLLSPDFVEIGASRRVWDRAQIVELLAGEAPDDDPIQVLDLQGRAIGDGLVLATWPSVRGTRRARRSSLWRRDKVGWRLVHHQGTPLREA